MNHDHLFLRISGVLYLGLMTNLMLTVTSLPLLVVLLAMDPRTAWALVAATAALAAPSLPAAFTVFRDHFVMGERAVVRPYLRAWVKHLRRGLVIGVASVALVTVLAVDIMWVWGYDAANGTGLGAVAVPAFGVIIALTLMLTLGALCAVVERPDASLPRLLKAALYLMVRRWYLSLISLAGGVVFMLVLAERPAIGMGILATPLLYVAWANTRRALTPILTVTAPLVPSGT